MDCAGCTLYVHATTHTVHNNNNEIKRIYPPHHHGSHERSSIAANQALNCYE